MREGGGGAREYIETYEVSERPKFQGGSDHFRWQRDQLDQLIDLHVEVFSQAGQQQAKMEHTYMTELWGYDTINLVI